MIIAMTVVPVTFTFVMIIAVIVIHSILFPSFRFKYTSICFSFATST